MPSSPGRWGWAGRVCELGKHWSQPVLYIYNLFSLRLGLSQSFMFVETDSSAEKFTLLVFPVRTVRATSVSVGSVD